MSAAVRHERDASGLTASTRSLPWGWIAAAALVLASLALLPLALAGVAGQRLRQAATDRGLTATWASLRLAYPGRVSLRHLALVRGGGDTLLRAQSVEARLAIAWPPRISRLSMQDAHLSIASADSSEEEAAWVPDDRTPDRTAPVDPRVRAAAQQWVEALLLPARQLPELRLQRMRLERGGRRLWIEALELSHAGARLQLSGLGTLALADSVPFEMHLNWHDDDAFGAEARFGLRDSLTGQRPWLTILLDGHLAQDRAAGELRLREGSTLTVGSIPFALSGRIARQGPWFEGRIAADGLTPEGIRASAPRELLGPLAGLRIEGSFDWQGAVSVDLSRPDSVRFDARVTPHGLVLSPDSQPSLLALHGPFVARIHLRSGMVTRELGEANPHYRPLGAIAPTLRDAVLTNEDGGFWWHRGFNTQAIQLAIAENLRAGRFKRGAGTITMQIARNLFLGQQKTLARKGQEVAFAWTLEHLARLPKERLLEIYLNIIEWGPGVNGADEAARYYFDKGADELSLDESLFLATLVPSPLRWRNRLTREGQLRPWVREQMRFIAGKMSAKGWLDSSRVVPADSLVIRLAGPAAAVFAVSDSARAARDSLHTEITPIL